VTWWAPTANTQHGGLHRLLFGRRPDQAEVPDSHGVKEDAYVTEVLGRLDGLGGPSAEVSTVSDETPSSAAQSVPDLAARIFDRDVDIEWRRTSYSGLIRVTKQPTGVSSEPEVENRNDEPESAAATGQVSPIAAGMPSPMADLPSGATFGSLVHGVLELADPEAPDLRGELLAHTRDQLQWWPVDVQAEEIAAALLPAQRTPLGPLASGLPLVDIPLRDRLCELDFEFPLTGGDRPSAARPDVRLGDVAGLLQTHLAPDDALASYADQLVGPLGEQPLRGYLSGSVDVVLRVPGPGGDADTHRYVVVDYKTNLLGEPGTPVTSADYGRAEMARAMLHSHYPLQALLYSVVLHRYLRWRLHAYDPSAHLGGVLYLFLRGMCGPETPRMDGHVAGVFDWSPPATLVTDLSDLLEGIRA
jgi:exodeoxyribonuclease V beta subunit